MTIVQPGKTASVRIVVTPTWLENDFEEKTAEVEEALDVIAELYSLSAKLCKGQVYTVRKYE